MVVDLLSGNVSVSVLSKVLSLDQLSCPQIWNVEKEKDSRKRERWATGQRTSTRK